MGLNESLYTLKHHGTIRYKTTRPTLSMFNCCSLLAATTGWTCTIHSRASLSSEPYGVLVEGEEQQRDEEMGGLEDGKMFLLDRM